ncbi:MAG: hypothetical protein WC346_18430 [Methanogenium sp.]|jgi:hypothetical protein
MNKAEAAALNHVKVKLEDELKKVQIQVNRNKYEIKKLAETQSELKRERKVLCNLIYTITPHENKK